MFIEKNFVVFPLKNRGNSRSDVNRAEPTLSSDLSKGSGETE